MKIKYNELLLRVLSYQRLVGEPESYYLWDKKSLEKITIENKDKCFDYTQAYDKIWAYFFILPEDFCDDPKRYLQEHKGRLYCPMLMKGNQKAMVFNFSIKQETREGEYIQLTLPLFS